ncbi:MAG: S-adenosylmethionine:tRNA ribosyltransferase-isomerase [Muribaculaceae bacterium]|nr:S-adenosylmethionine:tRNA ribosyltransferase-isomerase [Muribaculaceae bacterium]
MVKEISINDFDYTLPDDMIPVHPLEQRDECKLLLRTSSGKIYHRVFKELPDLLPPGALLVCNDTRVINARMQFHKDTGAGIELFLLEPIEPADYVLNFQSREECVWKCLVGNSKKWKSGGIFLILDLPDSKKQLKICAERLRQYPDGSSEVKFSWEGDGISFSQIIEIAGRIPIPPYLNRESEERDLSDYQTIYARAKGSVAAPTAGLHFTDRVFEGLEAHGVEIGKITLHVGAGTFKPVKSEKIGNHAMHSEPFSVNRDFLKKLIDWKREGKPVVAVGTTTVRTLESLPIIGKAIMAGSQDPFRVDQWTAYNDIDTDKLNSINSLEIILKKMEEEGLENLVASTSIMIAPGFHWRIVDAMVTNFHQPKSTLLLLVSSFIGGDDWRKIYEEALSHNYRFLSYGDASLLFPSVKG